MSRGLLLPGLPVYVCLIFLSTEILSYLFLIIPTPIYILSPQHKAEHTVGALGVVLRWVTRSTGTLLLTPGGSIGQKFSQNSESRAISQVKI